MSERRLKGKVVIVTGASRGLGQYCSVGYAREGATVVVAARTQESCNSDSPGTIYETARLVELEGASAMAVPCDVADVRSIESMIHAVLSEHGRIDVLMNNAGIIRPGDASSIAGRDWETEFNVNLHGPFRCARAVLPTMIRQQSGNIINISSVAASGISHYGITKRALETLTAALAYEQRGNGIAVNALKPESAIATPGLSKANLALPFDLPSPANYVEASILLAMQTPQTCTGQVLTDNEVLDRLSPES